MDYVELALAYWRLKNWVDDVAVERKLAAYSSLRKIERCLTTAGIELIGFDGQQYDVGLPVSVADTDECMDCDGKMIKQTLEPLIMQGEDILHYGRVILDMTDEDE